MSRTGNGALVMVLLVMLSACSMNRRAAETPANNQSAETTKSAEATKLADTTKPADTKKLGNEGSPLSVGQASGSYTSKGETVELKYAYVGESVSDRHTRASSSSSPINQSRRKLWLRRSSRRICCLTRKFADWNTLSNQTMSPTGYVFTRLSIRSPRVAHS